MSVMSEAIKSNIRNFIGKIEALQRELDSVNNPPRTTLQNIVDEAAKDLVPKATGEVASEVLKSFGFSGALARKYTSKATRRQIKYIEREKLKVIKNDIGLRIDSILTNFIEFISTISEVKPSLTIQGNSGELIKKFARIKSLKKHESKIINILGLLKEIEYYQLIENSRISEVLLKPKKGRQLKEPAYKINNHETIPVIITKKISLCNKMLMSKRNAKLFLEDMEIASELMSSCKSQDNFKIKIGVLATLFEVNLKPLRELVDDPDSSWKSIKLIEEWVNQENIELSKDTIELWKKIILLRDKMTPFHPTSEKLIEVYRYFGFDTLTPNFPKLWLDIIQRFANSLNQFYLALNKLE